MAALLIRAPTEFEMVGIHLFEPLAAGDVHLRNITSARIILAPSRVATLCTGATLNTFQFFRRFGTPQGLWDTVHTAAGDWCTTLLVTPTMSLEFSMRFIGFLDPFGWITAFPVSAEFLLTTLL